ncbi:MAG TPA: beta-ketoacyl synthase N-terminal-like domain-containing protein, partial [Pseudonocardia sp.]|nr:beta-ketoacyl synthase N-terminal-like domain-containing protein [Pseudonocardia sp.]
MAGPAERGVREWIAEWVARAAGVERSVVSATRPFDEYGLASRDIVALSGELSEEYGVAIPADAVYEFPTIAVLAAHTAALAAAGAGSAVNPSPDGGRGGQAGHEVAVVGVGCRFPGGVRGPRDLWRLLLRGGSAIADVPPGRWRSFAAGDPATAALLAAPAIARGGFLDDIAAFDAGFFGISPREAELMDPQQRIALEVVWEALDHAGIAPRSLVGSRAGVFTGVATVDYVPDGLAGFDGWGATGASMGVVASRISYQLDVRGPSVAVDTACSSSLVAVHMAKESLARGESDIALAGGVNLLVSPAVSIAFSSAGVLAPDGRCKTFDAAADGYVRSEGCGFVVLKRLDDARRDGDRVLAVIAGSATNANGRSNGLMAPHPGAQEELLRLAYRDAGIDPAQVQVVEAHGTGTALGDAIEVSAIAAVTMPDRRPGRPLLLGAVKTNLGHLEAAAGVAGFVKTVIAMQRGTVPPTVGLRRLNPALGLDTLPARVVTEAVEWPAAAGSRIAGVSSFGFGGVNAHVVLRDDRDDRDEREGRDGAGRRRRASAPAPGGRSGPVVLPVSAGSPESLRAEAASLREWLDGPGAATPLTALGSALATRRSTGQTRAAVVAANPAEARAGLDAVAGGGAHPQVCHGRVRDGCEPVFVFSGHGSQSPGMAALLLESDETFAAAIAELEPLVAAEAGLSVRAALTGCEEASDVGVVQPLLFCVQIGLARTWQARGVVPAAVIGHSMGEVAAAVVAGSLSLEDGVRVVCRRARLMRRLSGRGGMAAIPLGVRDAAEAVARAGLDGEVQIAVESAPAATVVAGTIRGIEKFMAACGESGIDAMRVDVDVASHSGAVDPILADLAVELADVRPRPAGIPMFSTVGGRDPAVPHRPDPAYWVDNLRQRVALPAAVRAAGERGHSVFVEVSPHPVLTGPVRATLEDAGVAEPEVFPTLHRETPDPTAFALAAARLHCLGHDIAWPAVTAEAERIELPVRAWDHRTSFWREPAPATRAAAGAHPLLGDPVRPADQERRVLWTRTLDGDALGPQHEHRVAGVPVMPASTLIEQVLAAATGAGLDDVVLRDLVLHTPVEVRPGTALQTVCDLDGGGESATIRLFHRDAGAGRWVQHATARAHRDRALVAALARVEGEQMPGASEPVDPAGFYRDLAAHGLEFGPGLRRLRTLRVAGGRAVLGLESVAPREASAAVDAGLLATTLQGVAAVMPAPDGAAPVVITGTGTVVLAAGAAGPDRATVELVDGAVGRTARAVLWAGDTAVGLLDDIRLGGTTAGAGSGRGVAGGAGTAPLHRVSWTVEPRAGAPRSERWLLAGGPEELAGALRSWGGGG